MSAKGDIAPSSTFVVTPGMDHPPFEQLTIRFYDWDSLDLNWVFIECDCKPAASQGESFSPCLALDPQTPI